MVFGLFLLFVDREVEMKICQPNNKCIEEMLLKQTWG